MEYDSLVYQNRGNGGGVTPPQTKDTPTGGRSYKKMKKGLTFIVSCDILNLTNEREVNKMNYYVAITVNNQPTIIINVGDSGKAYDVYANTKDALGNFALIQLVDGDTSEVVCSSDED